MALDTGGPLTPPQTPDYQGGTPTTTPPPAALTGGLLGAAAGVPQPAVDLSNLPNVSNPPGGPGGGATGGAAAVSPQQQLQDQLSWSNGIFQHYLGRLPSYRELLEIQRRGMTPEMLTEHIRGQGSYIPGISIGQLEDYHTNSQKSFDSWLGRDATDEDIRDLHNRGLADPQAIDEYIRNRQDVVAMHPGAPLNMQDLEYHTQKNSIDSSFLQNLGRQATDEEARAGITDRSKGPKPVQDTELRPEYQQGQGGLESKTMIAPNARNFA